MTHLQGPRAFFSFVERHLDVLNILGVFEREINLANLSIGNKFLCTAPPRLGAATDAVPRQLRCTPIFLASDITISFARACVVRVGRHANGGFDPGLDITINARRARVYAIKIAVLSAGVFFGADAIANAAVSTVIT